MTTDVSILQAQAFVSPAANSATVISGLRQTYNNADMHTLISTLRQEIETVTVEGNTSGLDAILVAQAITLQALFTNLLKRAQNEPNARLYDNYMRLAFKAQAQLVHTIASLKKNQTEVSANEKEKSLYCRTPIEAASID